MGWVVTVVTKTTFSLVAGESEVAQKQRRMNQSDAEGDPSVLRKPGDFVPFKSRPEVMLVGSAFAPNKTKVSRIMTRMVVGDIDKQIEVHADRWITRDNEIMPGPAFDRMALGWERASGGPGTSNPIGLPPSLRDERGRRRLPNLQPIGTHIVSQEDPLEPVGYGPIPSNWPTRKRLLGAGSQALLKKRWFDEPLADDFDPSFFNAAPSDQQLDALPEDLHIVLENLTPIAPRFVTNLPRLEPRIVIERGAAKQDLRALVDTVFIDTDRGVCTLTWRVHTPIGTPGEKGRILIEFEGHPHDPGITDFETMTGDEPRRESYPTMAIQTDLSPDARSGLPFRGTTDPSGDSPGSIRAADAPPRSTTGGRAGNASTRPDPPATLLGRTPMPQELRDVLPFRDPAGGLARAPSSRPQTAAPSGDAPASAAVAPPANIAITPPPPVPPAPAGVTPPLHGAVPPAPIVPNIGAPSHAAGPTPFQASPPTGLPASWSPPASVGALQPSSPPASPIASAARAVAPAPPPTAPLRHDAQPVMRGAVAASDAAAEIRDAPAVPIRRQRTRARELVDLLWFHEEAPARVRQRGEWFELLREAQREPEWIVGEAAEQELAAVKDRRNVARALSRVPPSEASEIATILQESVDEDGIYERPLLVVGGDLLMTFEPLEVLRNSAAVASQFASADKRLKDGVDAAQAALQGDTKPPGRLIESLLSQLRQTFKETNRSLPNDYLESSVQELLVEQRMYTKRSVLGAPRLRATFVPSGGGSHGMPAYLPEEVRERLPLFPRFRVRMLVEPHPQQDPSETESLALVALAVARVAPLP